MWQQCHAQNFRRLLKQIPDNSGADCLGMVRLSVKIQRRAIGISLDEMINSYRFTAKHGKVLTPWLAANDALYQLAGKALKFGF